MGSPKISSLLVALVAAAGVASHGHVTHIVIDGTLFQGYDPTTFPYMSSPLTVVGWSAEQPDNGFVSPGAYGTADMICHRAARPAQGHAQVRAGDVVSLQWSTWPESHHGPVMDWLAPCGGPCQSVDKASLRFFKIDGQGLVSGGSPGRYATDVLIDNGFTWEVKIPSNIKAGHYVLRHEIIALHSAGQADGAQSYPQCINLEIMGSGSDVPSGVAGTALYSSDDPGVLVNIYDASLQYQVPGGAVVAGGQSAAAQNPPVVQRTGTPTPAGGSGSGGGGGGGTSSTTAPTSSTRLFTSSSAPSASSTSSSGGGSGGGNGGSGAPLYHQCGGITWTGTTACSQGSCQKLNDYYFQCL